MNASLLLWAGGVLLVLAAVAFSVLAASPGRRWWCLPAMLALATLLALGLLGVRPPDTLWVIAPLLFAIALLGVISGSTVVSLVLHLATRGSVPLGTHGGILVRDADSPSPLQRRKEVLRGGVTIGFLERAALLGSVVAGRAGAVAVIVAIKGLARFSELEDETARERFIIGTLASLGWAAASAAAILLLGSS